MAVAKQVVIVGGGTAGWMAANLFSVHWPESHVTLVESPDIGIIGVGEGSTPQIRAFFDAIGVSEHEWMPACNATYKLGIRFTGWSSKPGFESYFHPFPAKLDAHTAKPFVLNCFARRQGLDVHAHPDRFFINAWLAERARGPNPRENFPFPVQYGYHFDAYLLGGFLRETAKKRGVHHRLAKVTAVNRRENGDIRSLTTDTGEELAGDLFIDSTGFAGILIQKTLGVPFRSFADNLFNDAAVVMPTGVGSNPRPQTESTALRCGWVWDIPLTNRTGNGYVYSSAYCSADEAETELRAHLGQLDSDTEARHLKMRVGQVQRHWERNCLAVGLSQGFIEPLEATALHLVQMTIEGFIRDYERGGSTDRYRDEFNARTCARFEGVRDYIVSHYRVSSRTDTDYWRANGTNEKLSPSLKQLLQTWLARGDLSLEIQRQQIEKYYTSISWHCLLAGYGLFPEQSSLNRDPDTVRPYALDEIGDFLRQCGRNYDSHEAALRHERKKTRHVPVP